MFAVPLAEEITRIILAVVVTFAAAMVIRMAKGVWHKPSRWVAAYMAFTLALYAGWRWFVVWLGTQPETLDYQLNWEPLVRSLGSWLLILHFVAVGFMAAHHVRETSKGRVP